MRLPEVLDEQRNGCVAMKRSVSCRGDESGQALVLFVVSLAVLMGLLALVVDVGAWLGTHQKLQSIADGAALAAVEQPPPVDTSSITAGTSATVTLNTSNPNAAGLPTTASATATDAAPIIFGGVVGISSFNESATATAQSLPVSAVSNSDLVTNIANVPPATAPPFVAPIVVNQCVFQQMCVCIFTTDCANQNLPDCFDPSVGCDLSLDTQDRTDSLFGIANIIGLVNPPNGTFANWMRCRPNALNRCAGGTAGTKIQASQSQAPLSNGTSGNGAVSAMNTTRGNTLILPVFSAFQGPPNNTYSLVGFSAFVVTTPTFSGTAGTGNWQNETVMTCGQANNQLCCGHAIDAPCKVIHGYFTQYNLPALFKNALLGGSGTGDYGVRGVGLTN